MEEGFNQAPERRLRVGMRIIKTVVAVLVCGVLGWLRDQSAFYSMIAAVICLQNSAGKTIQSSVNRLVGTLVGGVIGVIVVYVMDVCGVLYIELARYAIIAAMLIPIIEITLLMKKPAISAFACVVFLCVTVNHSVNDTPALFAVNRMVETLIGVAAACAVDLALPYRNQGPKEEPSAPAEEAPDSTAPADGEEKP